VKTLANERDRAEIARRLQTLEPTLAPRWGRLSVHQMICHLGDAFRMATGDRQVSPATGLFRGLLAKWIALYLPVRWPTGILTRPEIDQQAGGTPPGDFANDVAEVQALVEAFAKRKGHREWLPHPIFGSMSEAEWFRWAYLHADHHLRQFGV
jgi:hypothetical protein